MPELPEVEAARRAIQEHCAGKKVRRCVVADDSKVIDGVSPSELESALVGRTIIAALRKGKNLWLSLDTPPFPSFQFGMSGAIYIKGVAVTKYKRSAVSEKDEWPSKFTKVFVELEDGIEFAFTDKRRFARVRLLQDPTLVPPISELGPDALLEPLEIDEFVDALSKKRLAIKAVLLDQSFISGIGNWIADEVLYQARLHPLQIASSLSRENCETLHQCINEVIHKAVDVGADSNQYSKNWIFHYREKKAGEAFVDGKPIEFITAGGRTSAIVPELQKLTESKPEKKAQSSRSRKQKLGDEDNEGLDVEEKGKKGKRQTTKKGQNTKTGTKKQQKKADEEQERPKTRKEKKVDDIGGGQASKDGQKPVKGRGKQQKRTAMEATKKRSSNQVDSQQKKKARK
ncbi:hypothetical protein HPP92_003476 [Vanilla planifolia]|uniref:Formamidopyrimidine-DNA glycosylase catalytic domain-containing protein n=1 Tax=Vanilla planifolia TaxID=51239 RepID=A0A835S399_VANPL|nr:hypothetical protein HPP92_003476 [Vanilla planifolia]